MQRISNASQTNPTTGDAEVYTSERKAEFILSSAIDETDYQAARDAVRQMGLDPDRIEHYNPTQS